MTNAVLDGLLATWRAAPSPAPRCVDALLSSNHGDLPRWLEALREVPPTPVASMTVGDAVQVGSAEDLPPADRLRLEAALRGLIPWRKGPFELFGIRIDAEWRSDWKWRRIAPHVDLAGRRVLDVGCGNGYYGWRMMAAGAATVIGVEPSLLFVLQHALVAHCAAAAGINAQPRRRRSCIQQHALQGQAATSAPPSPKGSQGRKPPKQISATWAAANKYVMHPPAPVVLPLRLEDFSSKQPFDVIFSLGVLYHRRSPVEHLRRLAELAHRDTVLVLETLVAEDETLVSPKRYARMRNVHAVPTTEAVRHWLLQAGFGCADVVDVSATTTAEQRSTAWMPYQSLAEALHPDDAGLTVEGYPAPRRAVIIAHQ